MNTEEMSSVWKSFTEVSDPVLLPANPVVSILMLAYNHENYLSEAISRVLEQITEFPYELIIGEDCSTDDTRNIVLNYQKRFPSIIRSIFSEKNIGMHNNFLRLLNLSNGEFIAFCEGDDYWIDPNKLQVQVDCLRTHPNIGLCFHPVYSKSAINMGAEEVVSFHGDVNFEIPASELIKNGGGYCPSCSLMMRSEKIKYNSWLMQDLPVSDYFIQALSAIPNGAWYVGRVMGVYRRDVNGSFSSGMKLWKKRLELNKKLLIKLDKFNDYLDGNFSIELNHYKKKIHFSIIGDKDISKIEKIKLHHKYKLSLGVFEIFKMIGMAFFPSVYKFLLRFKHYCRNSGT